MAGNLRLTFPGWVATLLLAAAPLTAGATPATITFDSVSPVVLAVGDTQAVDQGFSLQATGIVGASLAVIDTGAGGDLASAQCLTFCTSNYTNAAFAFRSGGFSLTHSGDLFSVSSFDAAIATNGLSRATRFSVEGFAAGSLVASDTFLLLPNGYGSGVDETPLPADAAAGPAESFQSLSLTNFSNIDTLQFSYVGPASGDPLPLTGDDPNPVANNWGFYPDFVIDTIHVDLPSGQVIPEPASFVILLAGLSGLAVMRRRRAA